MPLDDREQRILEEIERQFYQEDPKLAASVRDARVATTASRNLRWAVLLFVIGFALMLGFFTRQTLVALLGFAAMVAAAAWTVAILRRRFGVGVGSPDSFASRLRRRRRDR
ncbi:MAG: DUF3040 domain-containing protein [Acidimicrobiia bacterium]|nr:MAG: DUF3040 domain-containing protein [Acidimicrobiia bacterium]